ncbi:hypothetical protein BDY21DRAFT_371743 [Lineolata rhizophorae]|uniref:FAD-binding domain-containing protein n=1 Tax=Lineolata rhizophorae TaxID=578093 RepID=A0A6A6P0N4_9PEZI|nr:hypothetical protein BDY21DRAFT_371743 [Lineolata rhizophorae]
MPPAPKIAILGAGPAGLTLATILHANNFPSDSITIFEASPTLRDQGGSLDLHPTDGQAALRAAGLFDAFAARARPESDVMKVVDLRSGAVLWDGNGPDRRPVAEGEELAHRPEIDRAALMEVLLSGVPAERIRWGSKVVDVVPASSGDTFALRLASGALTPAFDLVVGADGAFSVARRLLAPDAALPIYSGITAVELTTPPGDLAVTHPWLAAYVGAGSCAAFGADRAVQAQRQGDGGARVYGSMRVPADWAATCGIDWEGAAPGVARKQLVDGWFADVASEPRRALLECGGEEGAVVPRTLYMLPVGFRWDARPGITLVGDAAHLMTPFAGVGVNAAMADALELARGIVTWMGGGDGGVAGEGKNLAGVLRVYEEGMFPRAERYARKTMSNMEEHFKEGGSESFANRLRAAYGKPRQ